MEYLIGSLATVVFFVLVGGAYYLGTKQNKKSTPPLSEEDQRKAEQLQQDFSEIMGYSMDKALGGGRR